MSLAENPRAVRGHNNPPPDEEEDSESPPTVDEIRRVIRAVEYVQFRGKELEDLMTKRKGGRVLGWRLYVAWALKGQVRLCAIYKLLKFNRKTMGENQQRPERWCELDDELEQQLEHLREAIFRDGSLDIDLLDKRAKHWVKRDPELRELEELQRASERAAAKAESEAARLLEIARQKEIADLKYLLKGVKGKKAIVALHKGPKQVGGELSKEALAVLESVVKKEAKGIRRKASSFNADGLKECLKLKLVREGTAYLQTDDDPAIGPTAYGQQVFLACIEIGRIKRPKKKADA